jgi:ZIP family zinc transporter
MLEAFGWGLLAQSSLLVAGLLVCWVTGLWMLVGIAVFLLADQLVERRFGCQGAGGAMGIIVGSVVDGVPESAILGIQVGIGATISLSFVAPVLISNILQAIAPSADLAASGWGPRRPSRQEVCSRCSRTH